MTVAYDSFNNHMSQCNEAIEVYHYLKRQGYSADFGLRFIWVAGVLALDHYISELIVERATQHFADGVPLKPRLMAEGVPIARLIDLYGTNSVTAVVNFRGMLSQIVRIKTFQKADDIADGLAFIWDQKHKWNAIAHELSITNSTAKYKLNSIGTRRDQIVHSADFDQVTGNISPCRIEDAVEVVSYITKIVEAIDRLIVAS